MSSKDERFLQEGVARYEEARIVLGRFEDLLSKQIQKAVAARKSWGAFKKGAGKNAVRISLGKVGDGSPAIYVRVTGTIKNEKALIIAGVIWRNSEPCIFARFRTPKALSFLESPLKTKSVLSFNAGARRTFLYVELKNVGQLADDLNAVIDALLQCADTGREKKPRVK